jgi:hypothetical protein
MLTPFVWVLVAAFSWLAMASNASPEGIGNASRTVPYAGAIWVVTITVSRRGVLIAAKKRKRRKKKEERER